MAQLPRDRKTKLPQQRRFPPPWTVEEYNNACFIVRDANGQQLAYVYYESEPGRRSAAKLLSEDEARRIAANIAKLPELRRAVRRASANRVSSPY
jgi:endo-1,4-beta-D-glucanase Y